MSARKDLAHARIIDPDGDPASSWNPTPLGYYKDEAAPQEMVPSKEILVRSDGQGLIYRERINSLYGASEVGKSWVGLLAVRDAVRAGGRVLFLDHEDAGGKEIADRLYSLGVNAEEMDRVLYLAPEGPPESAAWKSALMDGGIFALCVIDAVTGAMAEQNRSGLSNDDVTIWIKSIVVPIIQYTWATVIIVDHVPLTTKGDRVGSIGAQAKRSTITGAAYRVQAVEPMIPGHIGVLDLYAEKDRHGHIRQAARAAGNKDRSPHVARITLDATDPAQIRTSIDPPPVTSAPVRVSEAERRDEVKERISRVLESGPAGSGRQVFDAVKGDRNEVLELIKEMVRDGYIALGRPASNRAVPHTLVRPFRVHTTEDPK